MPMQEQIRRMKLLFPDFRVIFNGGWHVEWEGSLRPLYKAYKLRITLVLKTQLDGMKIGPYYPRIILVDPLLELSTERAPGELVPHIYLNGRDPTKSPLCVFDPVADEWTNDMAIADTIIPWVIDWLVSYEGWLATGEWTGGGRDHRAAPK